MNREGCTSSSPQNRHKSVSERKIATSFSRQMISSLKILSPRCNVLVTKQYIKIIKKEKSSSSRSFWLCVCIRSLYNQKIFSHFICWQVYSSSSDSVECVSPSPVLHQWHLLANTTLGIPHRGGTRWWDQMWSKTRVAWKGRHQRTVAAEKMSHVKVLLSYESLKILSTGTIPGSWLSYETFHYWLIFKRAWCTCLRTRVFWWMSNTSDLVL